MLHLEEMLVVLLLDVELLLLPQLENAALVGLQGLAHRKPAVVHYDSRLIVNILA
jgi:hypothetical protein